MAFSPCSVITVIGLCSILGAAGACSSDNAPLDGHDADTSDVSRDGQGANDAVTPDAADIEVSVIDTVAMDTTRNDVVSSDRASGDAPVDAQLADRTSSDASSTDGAPGDTALADATPTDSTLADATPTDSTLADATPDAPPTDSTPADATSGDGGNDPSCPPSHGAASGQPCASTGLTCVYPEGACGCLMGCGALPPPDSGSRWFCGTRGAGCPIQKPVVGSTCTMDAQSCNYGTCCTDLMRCEGAQWKSGGFLCPP